MDEDILLVLSEIKYGIMNFDEAIEKIKEIFERYKNN